MKVVIFLLYSILNRLKIKEHNKFLAVLFTSLTVFIVAYILVQFATVLFGDGRLTFLPSPLLYAAALLCPVFAYSYAVNTKLISGKDARIKWFMIGLGTFVLIIFSLIVCNVNRVSWFLLEKVPRVSTKGK